MFLIIILVVLVIAWRIRAVKRGAHFLGGPRCPNCGSRMFVQTGSRYGAPRFWSCTRWGRRFRSCNGTREIDWDRRS